MDLVFRLIRICGVEIKRFLFVRIESAVELTVRETASRTLTGDVLGISVMAVYLARLLAVFNFGV